MKYFFFKISALCILTLFMLQNSSCRKDKFIESKGARLEFSQDSVLFDTVFTTIGSSTRNFRVRNIHKLPIKISSIRLEGGTSSSFIINVDGQSGISFSDIEIAGNDSMYIFVQVKVNPTNINSPLIISDALVFNTNGNEQKVVLEAWGQDAYYHYPTEAIKFKDGGYLPYSYLENDTNAITVTWPNDKPHVIYGYLVVYNKQKLTIPAGTRVYMNYKAGLWVYPGGQLQVLGQKGNEVIFQGARREKDYLDEPGQWDRIWINEGSDDNVIDYAIIKNGYIGVQCELFGDDVELAKKRLLRISNTQIHNMSLWGLYSLAYRIAGSNVVVSNCQEHSLNVLLGGAYAFVHCTFANYWSKGKIRDKKTVNINNYAENDIIPLNFYMGNCIVDGRLDDELSLDLKSGTAASYTCVLSNNWLKSSVDVSDANRFINNRLGNKDTKIKYKEVEKYDFSPAADEVNITGFVHPDATSDAQSVPTDLRGKSRNTTSVTAGAYEMP